jgi:hypothetical protein
LNYIPPPLKLTASLPVSPFTEYQIFKLLDTLKPTSPGCDNIPSWFLRVSAPFISRHVTELFNLSLRQSVVPVQWKMSIITPVAKVPRPSSCSDFRPISITPILSRLLEKLVVRHFLYPILTQPSHSISFQDQFAFRPTGSTTAALINLIHLLADLLVKFPYVHLIALDFSKAFDTVRHSTLLEKCCLYPIPDNLYNWLAMYLENREHRTKYDGKLSSPLGINASIVQGSGIGPMAYVINASDLHPLHNGNHFNKYADDSYLVVPSNNTSLIPSEIEHIDKWSAANNLKLNVLKTKELVVHRPRTKISDLPPLTPGLVRVQSLNILGVIFQSDLSFKLHAEKLVTQCAQSLYAVRTLRTQGLSGPSLWEVTRATLVSRLVYASQAWWGLLDEGSRQRLQASLNRVISQGFLRPNHPSIASMCDTADDKLFTSILHQPHHVLQHLLPPIYNSTHNLRPRTHNRTIPLIKNTLFKKTYINKMLLKDSY